MKVVIDAIPLLSPLTGVGNYIYQIARHLKRIDNNNDYSYFYGYYSKKLVTYNDTKTYYRTKEIINKIPILRTAARKLRDGIFKPFFYKKFDVYFEPNFIPLGIKAEKLVVAVFDFSFKLNPEWHPKEKRIYFENNFWEKIKRADKIIVISNFIKKEAVDHFGFDENKIRTIYPGCDGEIFRVYDSKELESVRLRCGLPDNFILAVGSVEPRKNLDGLINAYMALDKDIRRAHKIVIAGFKGWNNAGIMKLLKQAGDDVIYLKYIPDADLAKVYNLANLFVYPSLYEGFGFPPLEAMACGCPVVVSDAASLPEACGDAAYYVNPRSIESIVSGMAKVLKDDGLRNNLIEKGFERARSFRWERSAREHLRVFEEVFNA